jgi:hypothetical protein
VSKVATSAVCGMFERREGAASFNNNNPAPLSPHPRLLRAARCVLSIMRAAQQHTAATRVILRFPICCSIILTPPNVNFFVAIFCHICKSIFRFPICCSVILTPPNLHFFVAICQFSVIDARVIFRFPICCSVILTPPNLHFFVAICQFSVIDARIYSYFLYAAVHCHFDPTKSALFCGNLSIFCHRCKSHIQISYML